MVTETKGRERKKDSRVWGMQLLHSPHCSQNRTSIFICLTERMKATERVGSREIRGRFGRKISVHRGVELAEKR